jgi:glutamate synthase (NADPH/NADH) small chain
VFSSETLEFRGSTRVEEIVINDHLSGESVTFPADLVLIAAGFVGPELDQLALNAERHLTARQTLSVTEDWRVRELDGSTPVFACGDAVRGQSLIVWAIAEGRSAASAVDAALSGRPSALPAPVEPYALSW